VQRPGRETGGVSRSHVEAWARSLEAADAPAVTVARRLSAVSSRYAWLRQGDHVTGSPVEHITRPEVDQDTSATPGVTRHQAAALMAAADADPHPNAARTAAIVAVLLFTGMRVGELLGADVDDLGHNRGHHTLTVTRKGGKRAELALPAPATVRLDTYLETRGGLTTPPLPVTAAGRRLDPGTVWRLLRRLAGTSPPARAAARPAVRPRAAALLRHPLPRRRGEPARSARPTRSYRTPPPAATTDPAATSTAPPATPSPPTSPAAHPGVAGPARQVPTPSVPFCAILTLTA